MNKSTHLSPLLASASCMALAIGTLQAATITAVGTTGVFDSTNANSIDLDPTGTLAAFKTSVSTAYANNSGGVIDWETGLSPAATASATTAANNTLTTINVAYGVGASNTLGITFDRTILLYTNNVNSQVGALSSSGALNNAIIPDGGNGQIGLAYNMTFSGASVSEIGFGMLARSLYLTGINFSATATFSDLSTSVINYGLGSTLGDGAGSSDTFLHFAAPSGQTITSLFVTYVNAGTTGYVTSFSATAADNGKVRPVMDDFGFVVIPEPSAALLSLAGLGLLFRRRR